MRTGLAKNYFRHPFRNSSLLRRFTASRLSSSFSIAHGVRCQLLKSYNLVGTLRSFSTRSSKIGEGSFCFHGLPCIDSLNRTARVSWHLYLYITQLVDIMLLIKLVRQFSDANKITKRQHKRLRQSQKMVTIRPLMGYIVCRIGLLSNEESIQT